MRNKLRFYSYFNLILKKLIITFLFFDHIVHNIHKYGLKKLIIIILFSLLWGAAPVGETIEQISGISLRLKKLATPQSVIIVPPLRAVPDISTTPKTHKGGMVALYKGYKVFLANCTQFISTAADKLIALFKRYVLPGPPPTSVEELNT